MTDALTIKQAGAGNAFEVLVTLSDDRVLLLTLEQILSVHPQELPKGKKDSN